MWAWKEFLSPSVTGLHFLENSYILIKVDSFLLYPPSAFSYFQLFGWCSSHAACQLPWNPWMWQWGKLLASVTANMSYWGGGWQNKEKILKENIWGKKNVKRANLFLKSKLSKVVLVLTEDVLWQKRYNTGYYTMDIEFSLKAPQWDIPTSC